MSRVFIYKTNYSKCEQAVEQAFASLEVNLQGKRVVIKPNALRGSAPEEGVTTHPAVLAAVVKAVERRSPASIIVGDNPGVYGYGMNEKVFRKTGLLEAAGSYYRNLGADTVEREIVSRFVQSAPVPRAILEADYYISLPKFKTHGLTVLSCAIKNNFGLLPGGLKAQFHKISGNPHHFAEALVDVFAIRAPDLVIVDAVLAMEGNGPVSTSLRYVGKILAGDDPVAVDAVVARMMGCDPLPRTVALAAERGLGKCDLSGIEVSGPIEAVQDFRLPAPLSPGATTSVRGVDWNRVTSVRPLVDVSLCDLCQTCIKHCPAGALAMEDHPVVSPEKCITCFCCQELCPRRAIELK